jgi:ABC-type nitrate/sulfonate/bicarbonate transport system ATPase subunit
LKQSFRCRGGTLPPEEATNPWQIIVPWLSPQENVRLELGLYENAKRHAYCNVERSVQHFGELTTAALDRNPTELSTRPRQGFARSALATVFQSDASCLQQSGVCGARQC